jgi:hypothetical protein
VGVGIVGGSKRAAVGWMRLHDAAGLAAESNTCAAGCDTPRLWRLAG